MNEDYYNRQITNEDCNNRQPISYQQQGQPLQGQPPQGQPPYGQYPFYTSPQYGTYNPVPGNGLASASLVCGILSLVLLFLFFVSIILGIIAIATGASAKKNGFMGGKATAGTAMGIIATVFNAVFICLSVIILFALSGK